MQMALYLPHTEVSIFRQGLCLVGIFVGIFFTRLAETLEVGGQKVAHAFKVARVNFPHKRGSPAFFAIPLIWYHPIPIFHDSSPFGTCCFRCCVPLRRLRAPEIIKRQGPVRGTLPDVRAAALDPT